MKISFDSKGDFANSLKWLNRMGKSNMNNTVSKVASRGTSSLSSATPRDTGSTANSWKQKISKTSTGVEVSWSNTAHPESSVSVAKLIDSGHGTRNGGYVQPRPYIKDAMKPIWGELDKAIRKELSK